jgi:hypothetical protein
MIYIHKFEVLYLDRLNGVFSAGHDVYYQSSPINHIRNLSKLIRLYYDIEDQFVLSSQAELMINALCG